MLKTVWIKNQLSWSDGVGAELSWMSGTERATLMYLWGGHSGQSVCDFADCSCLLFRAQMIKSWKAVIPRKYGYYISFRKIHITHIYPAHHCSIIGYGLDTLLRGNLSILAGLFCDYRKIVSIKLCCSKWAIDVIAISHSPLYWDAFCHWSVHMGRRRKETSANFNRTRQKRTLYQTHNFTLSILLKRG